MAVGNFQSSARNVTRTTNKYTYREKKRYRIYSYSHACLMSHADAERKQILLVSVLIFFLDVNNMLFRVTCICMVYMPICHIYPRTADLCTWLLLLFLLLLLLRKRQSIAGLNAHIHIDPCLVYHYYHYGYRI